MILLRVRGGVHLPAVLPVLLALLTSASAGAEFLENAALGGLAAEGTRVCWDDEEGASKSSIALLQTRVEERLKQQVPRVEVEEGLPQVQGIRPFRDGQHQKLGKGMGKQQLNEGYFWPSGRGSVGHYSQSRYTAPRDLNASFAWSWHDPRGRYFNVPTGVNIDDKKNIYLTSLDGIRKFTQNGELIWTFERQRNQSEELPDTSSLHNGVVYTSTTAGRIIALNMETGQPIWVTKLESCDGNNGWVTAHAGVVITGSDALDEIRDRPSCCGPADHVVTGLNATDGNILWRFKPEAPVWNFVASFADDGTFTFQDLEGRAYRHSLADGKQIWKNGGIFGTWTDGGSTLGPNGVVYAVTVFSYGSAGPEGHGLVSAYRFEDGKLLWNKTVPRPPNNVPAIGRLAGRKGLSLIQPIGQQVLQGAPTDIYALDAETGEVQWIFNGPAQQGALQAGDSNLEAVAQRTLAGVRAVTLPNPWGAPSIDGAGTVFIGSEEGPLYSLVDANSDGHVVGESEVSIFDTGACFVGSSSPAIAPGMLVACSIDAMYVFKL